MDSPVQLYSTSNFVTSAWAKRRVQSSNPFPLVKSFNCASLEEKEIAFVYNASSNTNGVQRPFSKVLRRWHGTTKVDILRQFNPVPIHFPLPSQFTKPQTGLNEDVQKSTKDVKLQTTTRPLKCLSVNKASRIPCPLPPFVALSLTRNLLVEGKGEKKVNISRPYCTLVGGITRRLRVFSRRWIIGTRDKFRWRRAFETLRSERGF